MRKLPINITKNASSWNNGSPNHITGTGLGLRIDAHYQPSIFNQGFTTIDLYHKGNLIAKSVNVANKSCRELIHKDIGLWLIQNRWDTWPANQPHRFTIIQKRNTNSFEIL